MVEEALPHLRGPAVASVQLLEELALLGAEVGGDDHPHHAELVAAASRADVGNAHPADPDHPPVLGSRGELQGVLAIDGGDGDAVAEHRLGDGDRELVDQLLAAADEVGMVLDAEGEVEVAGGAAPGAGLALAGDAHLDVLVDAGGDLHLDGLADLDPALAAAAAARPLDDPALALAAGAGA